jgi:hypothetical protein
MGLFEVVSEVEDDLTSPRCLDQPDSELFLDLRHTRSGAVPPSTSSGQLYDWTAVSSCAGVMVRGSDRLRFRRTPLSEEDREDDDTADGHELALPVLE